MTKNRSAINFSIILGITAALLVFIFILVAHHRGVPDRVQQHRSALLSTDSNVAERTQPVGPAGVASAKT